MKNSMLDVRSRVTPVPTPVGVRLGSSILIATAVASLVSDLAIPYAAPTALICIIAALILPLWHPYRRELRAFADKHHVTMMPTLQSLIPLMALWLIIMLAPLANWPLWGTIVTWVTILGLSFLMFPHVDGTRKMAYA